MRPMELLYCNTVLMYQTPSMYLFTEPPASFILVFIMFLMRLHLVPYFMIRSMEGICFEVKPRDDPIKDHPLCAHKQTPPEPEDKRKKEEGEEEIQYRLTLVGSLAIHPLTTMAMLPWVVAEIRRPRLGGNNRNQEFNGAYCPEVSLFDINWMQNMLEKICYRKTQQSKAKRILDIRYCSKVGVGSLLCSP